MSGLHDKFTKVLDPLGITKKVGKGLKNIIAPKIKVPDIEMPEAPNTMPLADDDAARKARRRALARRRQAGGRASTVLSESGEGKLGG